MSKSLKSAASGQALLIVVLVMAVALTIGLGVASRSLTNIKISSQQEDSARVFSVAEAGIEESLLAGSAQNVSIGDISAVVQEVNDPTVIGGGPELLFQKEIDPDDTQTVWLVAHNLAGLPDPRAGKYQSPGDQIEICWGNETITGEIPALVVTLFYRLNGQFYTRKFAVDPNNSVRRNNFSNPDSEAGCTIGGRTLRYSKILDLPHLTGVDDAYFFLRLKLLYSHDAAHSLGVRGLGIGNPIIPLQGECFESTATHGDTGLTRKVRHCQPFKVPPGIFDYSLFSADDLTKY